jgi:hypothetical protein
MHELADASRSQRPGVQYLISEGAEYGLCSFENSPLATDHDFVNAARRAWLARSDRGVENESSFGRKPRLDATHK